MTTAPGPLPVFRRLLRSTAGANLVEYGVMLGLVALVGVVGFRQLGGSVSTTTETYAGCIKLDGSGRCSGGGGSTTASGAGAPPDSCPGGICTRPDLGQCFVAGTKVATPSGERSIEQIATGDTVYSRDARTGELVVKLVGPTFVTPNMPLADVHVRDDFDGIVATRGHPFFTLDRGWVEAQALEPGEPLVDVSGGPIYVDFVERLSTRATVYNFEVEETHTYFVGAAHAWVHNPLSCNGNTGTVTSNNPGSTTIIQLSPDPKNETTLADSVGTYGKLNPGSTTIDHTGLTPGSLTNTNTVMVITHGSPGSLAYGPSGSLNGTQLGQQLNNAGFDGTKPGAEVHVLACNSGTVSLGGHCVAQAVADTTGATTTGAVANSRPQAIINQYTGGVLEKPFPSFTTGQAQTGGGGPHGNPPGPYDVQIPFNGTMFTHGPPVETVDNGTMQEFKPKPPKKKKLPKKK